VEQHQMHANCSLFIVITAFTNTHDNVFGCLFSYNSVFSVLVYTLQELISMVDCLSLFITAENNAQLLTAALV
jgi:hypothetical protein